MVVGTFSVFAIKYWESVVSTENSSSCKTSKLHFYFGYLMYFSYLVLFVNFFYKSYIDKPTIYEPKKVEELKTTSKTPEAANLMEEQRIYQTLRKRT